MAVGLRGGDFRSFRSDVLVSVVKGAITSKN